MGVRGPWGVSVVSLRRSLIGLSFTFGLVRDCCSYRDQSGDGGWGRPRMWVQGKETYPGRRRVDRTGGPTFGK